MKLQGARFKNFACFNECYVPLQEGVQLLVGKNNAGKTALLRGLTALSALPVERVKANIYPGVEAYCRSGSEFRFFELDLHFSVEESDGDALGGILENAAVKLASRRLVEFRFRVVPSNSSVVFLGAHLAYGNKTLPLAERSLGHAARILYNPSAQRTGVEAMAVSQQEVGKEEWPILGRSSLTSCLHDLRNVRIVDAHRVVSSWSLQALDTLASNANSLAAYLDTLIGTDRDKFEQIEDFVISVFPEYKHVNPSKEQNTVLITLTTKNGNQKIPLSHCGTGTEQLLALATFVFTSDPGTLLLLDEPHSYLHPVAERELIRLLLEHPEHRYLISTHSAILINAVTPDRILSLPPSGIVPDDAKGRSSVAGILHSLGYQNSDLLFSDRLIFVEGESDREVLTILLAKVPSIVQGDLNRTGFPTTDGHGPLNALKKQSSLIHYEKLLEQVGRQDIPRIYLFDGDCAEEGRQLIADTPLLKGRTSVAVRFLPRWEIENYLLVPEAIAAAIRTSAELQGVQVIADAETISRRIQDLLDETDGKFFPGGRGDDPRKTVKASLVLEKIFDEHQLRYNKRNTGRLIATGITGPNQPALTEIWDLVKGIFPEPKPRSRFV